MCSQQLNFKHNRLLETTGTNRTMARLAVFALAWIHCATGQIATYGFFPYFGNPYYLNPVVSSRPIASNLPLAEASQFSSSTVMLQELAVERVAQRAFLILDEDDVRDMSKRVDKYFTDDAEMIILLPSAKIIQEGKQDIKVIFESDGY